jgi:hypothetical protein
MRGYDHDNDKKIADERVESIKQFICSNKAIKEIILDEWCLDSMPQQYDTRIVFINNKTKHERFDSIELSCIRRYYTLYTNCAGYRNKRMNDDDYSYVHSPIRHDYIITKPKSKCVIL